MKLFNLGEERANRAGILTPQAIMEHTMEYMKDQPVEKIAIVIMMEDGTVKTANSSMTYASLMAMHEIAKLVAYDNMP